MKIKRVNGEKSNVVVKEECLEWNGQVWEWNAVQSCQDRVGIVKIEWRKVKETWKCAICDFVNNGKKCELCGVVKQAKETKVEIACLFCTFLQAEAICCQICGKELMFVMELECKESKELYDWIQTRRCVDVTKAASMPSLGVNDIMRALDQQQLNTQETLNDSFKDIDNLALKAKEMVQLAESITSKLSETEENEFRNQLLHLGISNPITKDSSGVDYYKQLADQLQEFLNKWSELNTTGMVDAIEIYCVFNRARGISLVSPDDFLKACDVLKKCNRIQLRKCDDGSLIIQTHSDDALVNTILEQLKDLDALISYITPMDLVNSMQIGDRVALEQLLHIESLGLMCRDETTERGLRFYKNLFVD